MLCWSQADINVLKVKKYKDIKSLPKSEKMSDQDGSSLIIFVVDGGGLYLDTPVSL